MRKMMAIGGAVCAAALTLSSGAAMATQPIDGATVDFPEWSNYMLVDGHKVTYCHRTGSAKNPYVVITSDIASVNDLDAMTSDHQSHEQVGNGLGPDIIPISELVKRELKGLVPIELCIEQPPVDDYS
jgi:hypothetical protein